jgi:hypothetical protein
VQLPGCVAKAAVLGTGQACRLVYNKRWIGSVGRVIHRGGPGAAALETIESIARNHAEEYSVYTGLFTRGVVNVLQQSIEWTRPSASRRFSELCKGLAP